jgi:hypothetical protein
MSAATSVLIVVHFALVHRLASAALFCSETIAALREMLNALQNAANRAVFARRCGAGKNVTLQIHDERLTAPAPRLYCAPFQPKRDFRDFPVIDGP